MFVYEHHRCSLISVITSGSAIWDNNWEKQQQHDLPGPANRDNDLPVNHVPQTRQTQGNIEAGMEGGGGISLARLSGFKTDNFGPYH